MLCVGGAVAVFGDAVAVFGGAGSARSGGGGRGTGWWRSSIVVAVVDGDWNCR